MENTHLPSPLKTGLAYATEEYKQLAELHSDDQICDVKPKEDQLKCALYRAFAERGYLVHVEASYERNGEECDLIASKSGEATIAIEIKTAWAGKGWINKPKEQAASWRKDIEKLNALRHGNTAKADEGYFILCFAYEKDSLGEQAVRRELSELDINNCMDSFSICDWNGLNAIDLYTVRIY